MSDNAPLTPPRRSLLRLIAATIGIIIMVFSGGCVLLFVVPSLSSDPYGIIGIALAVGGLPFLVGLLITYLALRRSRTS
jgi:hypothetical protein